MVVSVSDFNSFIRKILSEGLFSIQQIIVPSGSVFSDDQDLFFAQLHNKDDTIDPGEYRTVDPIKFLFYFPREKVLPIRNKIEKRLLLGVKSCDLNALSILDTTLTDSGFTDPLFKDWRKNTIIISSDCTSFLPNCFCTLLGEKPHPDNGFDLNLSHVGDQYLITTGSSTGEEMLELMKQHVNVLATSEDMISSVKRNREELKDRLNYQVKRVLSEDADENTDENGTDKWINASEKCVGCGSCTNICPTCYCLILNDESQGQEFVKVRSYDSCQLNGYARVAGGGTPRPKMHQRFRNRVMCKFSYMKNNFGRFGCTGCGRCLDACAPGNDFIKVSRFLIEDQMESVEFSAKEAKEDLV